jgi:hypothetical protein
MRKVLLFATAALAVAALVVPAAAWADKLYDSSTESELTVHTELTIEGTEKFESLGSGFSCTVPLVLTDNPTVKPAITQIKSYETNACTGFGTLFKECMVKKSTITGLPWAVEIKAKAGVIIVKDKTIEFELEPKMGKTCKSKKVKYSYAEETLTPDKVKGFTSVTESGTGTESIDGGEPINVAIGGTESVKGEASGTYGIEE